DVASTVSGGMAAVETDLLPRLGRTPAGSRGVGRLGAVRRAGAPQVTEARGAAASRRRDSLFRRMLAEADLVAVTGAFMLTAQLSPSSPRLSWASVAGLPFVFVGAKLYGLYDRDEALIRKTTLDEAPKLLHLATLCTL